MFKKECLNFIDGNQLNTILLVLTVFTVIVFTTSCYSRCTANYWQKVTLLVCTLFVASGDYVACYGLCNNFSLCSDGSVISRIRNALYVRFILWCYCILSDCLLLIIVQLFLTNKRTHAPALEWCIIVSQKRGAERHGNDYVYAILLRVFFACFIARNRQNVDAGQIWCRPIIAANLWAEFSPTSGAVDSRWRGCNAEKIVMIWCRRQRETVGYTSDGDGPVTARVNNNGVVKLASLSSSSSPR